MVALWTAPAPLRHTRRPSRKAAGEVRLQKHASAPKTSATSTAETAGSPAAVGRREGRRRVAFQYYLSLVFGIVRGRTGGWGIRPLELEVYRKNIK